MIPFPSFEACTIDSACIVRTLHAVGGVLIRNLAAEETNASLLRLCRQIGLPTETANPDAKVAGVVENGFVHRVEAKRRALRGRHGAAVLSTTNLDFRLHSDEFFSDRPAEIVLLHCFRSARTGGASIFAAVNDAVLALRRSDRDQLAKSAFPVGNSVAPLIWSGPTGWCARFNPYELGHQSAFLTPQQLQAIENFEHSALACSFSLVLKPHDCLVWFNHRFLHGRSGFKGDGRLLKRVRLHLHPNG